MKHYLLTVTVLFFGAFAFAEGKENHFAERKQHALQEMDLHISALQSAKSCMSAAVDPEGLKQCHETLEHARRKFREENIDRRIHELEQEKSKLEK